MSGSSDSRSSLSPEIITHYEGAHEVEHLSISFGPLELTRTQELVMRHVLPPPAVVLDVSAGAGVYSLWLARQGYEVYLVDAVPLHVEQARLASQAQPDHPIASIAVGDARQLDRADASMVAARRR
ncbi:MAG: class I SAM-dependent methyltransferase [Acidobacteria bacterium]|nr:class I SAM-dependent methyltransferase [Acidobacteriota bacterium]